ncbi:hypothetical protein SY83_04055 [Paenibacillus swuensis]|uniref:HTH araC/xylS-type domain-containing protein n=1 Tax=Paenibacillus swuensis TaxID=1178515 RepID=A0A172TF23_9BACL|nr:AraC family transcriptional regulator [Paenibacillus swuensis]ANE45610.1 hypothetical protein SY83_04055 [Paenibacillus swuensis]
MKQLPIPQMSGSLRLSGGHIAYAPAEWSYHKHQHPTYELLYCLEGRATEWINGNSVSLSEGDWLYLNRGVMHSTMTEPDSVFTYFTVHFDMEDEGMKSALSRCSYWCFPDGDTGMAAQLTELRRVLEDGEEADTNLNVRKLRIQSVITTLVAELLLVLEKAEPGPELSGASRKDTELAHTIEKLLTEAVFTSETIESIAKRLYISRNHCTAIFLKVYGIAPHRYLSLMKLKKAKELILRSDDSLESIGERLGFSCASSFSRQFRRWTGHAPAVLRRTDKPRR